MDEALGFGATQMQQEFAMINSSSSRMDLTLQMNFENLFNTFPGIVHTEIGVLMLYTMFQTSPIFATSLAAIDSTIRFGYVGHFIVTDNTFQRLHLNTCLDELQRQNRQMANL